MDLQCIKVYLYDSNITEEGENKEYSFGGAQRLYVYFEITVALIQTGLL